jgi:transglutaminase-like putative cysteine protease
MVINRRRFLQLSGALGAAALLPRTGLAQERFITTQGPWRKFDIVTQLRFKKPPGRAQAWIPVPSVNTDEWSKALGSDWTTNASTARLEQDAANGVDLVYLEWTGAEAEATVEISSHAETRDRVTEFTMPAKAEPLTDEERLRYTAPVSFVPHSDWLKTTAAEITENAKTDLGKAKAIYEWIVEERTCETNDLTVLLGTGDEGTLTPQGCDYLNSLFVHLARVSGLPAREIYGVRVAPSQYSYKTLSALPEDVTAEGTARAEVWLADYGWVPASPGDVRRVIRGEAPGNLELTDPKAVAARVTLFGAWEGNWIAYNTANDFVLPESGGVKVPFLIAPRLMSEAGLVSNLEAEGYAYKLIANELPA